MSTVKISELPNLPSISSNTSNTLFLGVDIPTSVTGKFTATTLAQQLYANNFLVVGDYEVTYPNAIGVFAYPSNNYIQTIVENESDNGTSDVVAQANVSTDIAYYIDMGFAGSSYSNSSPFNSLGSSLYPLDGYLYVQGNTGHPGGNLVIGTTVTGTQIRILVGGIGEENVVAHANSTGLYSATISNASNYANGAFKQANAAFIVANTAAVAANTPSHVSNSASSYANGAFIQANAAFLQANTPSHVANSASVYANAAFDKANSALANTTGTFAGSLTVTGTLVAGNVTINNGVSVNDGGLFQYTTANNGTVTQLTNKNIPVTCNGRTGQITTNNSALAGGRSDTFRVNNSQVAGANDIIIIGISSGATGNTYQVCTTGIGAGYFDVTISNISATSHSDALVLNFAILRVQ